MKKGYYIRFLRAFGGREYSYIDTLKYELTSDLKQIACQQIYYSDNRWDRNGRILSNLALLLHNKAIEVVNTGDCWSKYRPDGSLYATRQQGYHAYNEAFARPYYKALVVPVQAFNKKYREYFNAEGGIAECIKYTQQYGLEVLVLNKDWTLASYRSLEH